MLYWMVSFHIWPSCIVLYCIESISRMMECYHILFYSILHKDEIWGKQQMMQQKSGVYTKVPLCLSRQTTPSATDQPIFLQWSSNFVALSQKRVMQASLKLQEHLFKKKEVILGPEDFALWISQDQNCVFSCSGVTLVWMYCRSEPMFSSLAMNNAIPFSCQGFLMLWLIGVWQHDFCMIILAFHSVALLSISSLLSSLSGEWTAANPFYRTKKSNYHAMVIIWILDWVFIH